MHTVDLDTWSPSALSITVSIAKSIAKSIANTGASGAASAWAVRGED